MEEPLSMETGIPSIFNSTSSLIAADLEKFLVAFLATDFDNDNLFNVLNMFLILTILFFLFVLGTKEDIDWKLGYFFDYCSQMLFLTLIQ